MLKQSVSILLILAIPALPVFAEDAASGDEFELNSTGDLLALCTIEESSPEFHLAAGICLGMIAGVLYAHPAVVASADYNPNKKKSQAGKGAKVGAAAGAARGFLWGLILDDDPIGRAATSAAVGATAGAVAGSFYTKKGKKPLVCLDDDITVLDAGQQFVIWAEKNPGHLKSDPSEGIVRSAQAVWPCKKK